ncbi:cysteine-rich secretory protein LCCL [Homalodisca vitripennis]|nr:cysteine-rich secretory protein LCCL [Homalodisca vitripennis]
MIKKFNGHLTLDIRERSVVVKVMEDQGVGDRGCPDPTLLHRTQAHFSDPGRSGLVHSPDLPHTTDKRLIVDTHNQMRSMVASGRIAGQPAAANMLEMSGKCSRIIDFFNTLIPVLPPTVQLSCTSFNHSRINKKDPTLNSTKAEIICCLVEKGVCITRSLKKPGLCTVKLGFSHSPSTILLSVQCNRNGLGIYEEAAVTPDLWMKYVEHVKTLMAEAWKSVALKSFTLDLLLAGLYLQVEPTLGTAKTDVSLKFGLPYLSRSEISLTANVEILGSGLLLEMTVGVGGAKSLRAVASPDLRAYHSLGMSKSFSCLDSLYVGLAERVTVYARRGARVWDEELARKAQQWADQCINGHDSGSARRVSRFAVGQNIASSWTSPYPNRLGEYPDFASQIKAWFNEVYQYRGGYSHSTGHYSQIVWGDTHSVGCGYSYSHDGSRYTKLYVCNYGPGGNVLGYDAYRRGYPSCAQYGMSPSRRFPSLCEARGVYDQSCYYG